MGLSTLIPNTKGAIQTVRQDLSDYRRTRGAAPKSLSPAEQKALIDLKRDGYAVVENFWPRQEALDLRDRLETLPP